MERWLENFARASFQRSADTAHDLKTPLNVAVLNLELMRMRLRKLSGDEVDEKVAGYARAIEAELRRMANIFDAFFPLSTPPANDGAPEVVDVAPIIAGTADAAGMPLDPSGPAPVVTHEARIRRACKLFFEGASKNLASDSRAVSVSRDASHFNVTVSGRPRSAEVDVTKLFKFYYTDPDGAPDLSLAAARLIAETYGGEVTVAEGDRDTVSLRLSLPLGAE